jgi:glycosyltransferase involved in cell wall biosynthesis
LPEAVAPRPLVLIADVAMLEWRRMAIWRALRPWSRAVMSGSFALERRALRRAALVVAWSEWTRRGLSRRAPEANIRVLHPGLDLDEFRPAVRRSERSRPRVLFVGGRFAAKGGYDLLAALDPLLGRDLDLELVTPQEIPEREGLSRSTLGPGDALAERFRQADLLALPTHGDAIPWVVLEAMASGTPVVSTPVGAIPELLENGRSGVLVPPGRPDLLRRAVVDLLEDQPRRVELGQSARALCEAHYDARRQTALLADELLRLPARPR